MPQVARAVLAALGLAAAGCGDAERLMPVPLDAGRVGASIAVLSSGEVAVVNPDHGTVSLLDPATLALRATLAVGGEPHALLPLASGALLVSTFRGGEVVLLDPTGRREIKRGPACAGAWGLAADRDDGSVLVACAWEGSIVRLDPTTLTPSVVASGLSRPHAVAAIGGEVWAADFTGGLVHRIDASGDDRALSLTPADAPYRPALTSMQANLAAAILPAFGRVHVAHELVNHTGDTAAEKVDDDYGSVTDGNPKINPAVSSLLPDGGGVGGSDPPVLYARYDGGPRAFNGPSALASFGDRYLLVSNLSTADVAVLDTSATTPDGRVVASFAVGAGPSGVAVDASGRVAFVDNALDGSVSRLDLTRPRSAAAPRYEAALTAVIPLPPVYSFAALEGRRIFHDATDPHLTPSRVVACSTCHPAGEDDGLVWFIHTSAIALKRRRTPHLADAHGATAPFHWSGEFATLVDLVGGTVTDLMAGDGLLVDGSAVQAYIDEIVRPPVPAPPPDAAAVSRGQAVFVSSAAGCAACHGGPDLTDNGFHAVLTPMSLHADDVFPTANTPALHGLFLRPPYFHDGRARDLRDLLTRPDAAAHGGAASLSPGELDDLLAYLRSL